MKIEVFHDTVCPWCRIGKRHLKLALAEWEGEAVDVRYRSFFLNENIPVEGYPFRPFMEAKGGGRVSAEEFFAGPRRAGEQVGLVFNFERIERAPNSMLSHRLIVLTPDDKKEAMIDAVYAAYFEHGRDIGDLETLVAIAAAQGLDAAETRAALAGEAGRDEVLADVQWARAQGIGGVPFFIIDGRYAFSGAQPPETIGRVLQQAAYEKEEIP